MQKNDLDFLVDDKSLTGFSEDHLVEWREDAVDIGESLNPSIRIFKQHKIHPLVVGPLTELRKLAGMNGYDLRICSSYRSFPQQLKIWNWKVNGLRPVYDDRDVVVDLESMSKWRQIQAIMRWSALPGASRHHWGTDFDIYDASKMHENYRIRLSAQEAEGDGLFAPFHNWLDTIVCQDVGFYRPYDKDRGGIGPERWHLSYRPVAQEFADRLTQGVLETRLVDAKMFLKDVVLENLDNIYERYICL